MSNKLYIYIYRERELCQIACGERTNIKFVLINVLQRVVVMGSMGTMGTTHNVVVMGISDTPNTHIWHKDRLKPFSNLELITTKGETVA